MLFFAYSNEIRFRLLYVCFSFFATFLTSYFYKTSLLFVLSSPIILLKNFHGFIYTEIAEGFYANIHLCLLLSVYCIFPFFIYSLWSFLAKALYLKERFLSLNFLTCVFGFHCMLPLCLHTLLPILWDFFYQFEIVHEGFSLQCELRITSFVSFLFTLSFLLYTIFFISLSYLFFRQHLSTSFLSRKYFIILVALASSALCPPDLSLQLITTIFFFLGGEFLYFFSLYIKNL